MDKIELITEEALEADLYTNLKEHRMPDHFLYIGDEGAKNWLKMENSREFPVTGRLTSLLRKSLPALTVFIPPNTNVVSIGTGNGEKERIILETLAKRGNPAYFPVDVSARLVDISMEAVRHIPIITTGIVGLFEEMDHIRRYWRPPSLLCILGNTFCNFEPDIFFSAVSRNLGKDDLFLFDCHMLVECGGTSAARKKNERTYRARRNTLFNLDPLLRRGVRADDVEFRMEFLPVQTEVGIVYRTSKSVLVRKQCVVSCGKQAIFFRAGDSIRLGFAYKYTPGQIEPLLKRHGFNIMALHKTVDNENILVLARKKAYKEGRAV